MEPDSFRLTCKYHHPTISGFQDLINHHIQAAAGKIVEGYEADEGQQFQDIDLTRALAG